MFRNMFKSFSKIIYCVSFFACVCNSAESSCDWGDMITSTKPAATDISSATWFIDAPIDWTEVKRLAESGDPSSQYCYGQRCLIEAEKLTNGARLSKRFEGYMFLLMAAICGEFTESIESFIFVGDITDLKKETPLNEFMGRAEEFAKNI